MSVYYVGHSYITIVIVQNGYQVLNVCFYYEKLPDYADIVMKLTLCTICQSILNLHPRCLPAS